MARHFLMCNHNKELDRVIVHMFDVCPKRLLIGLEYALLVWWTPSVRQEGGFPLYYYAVVLLSYAVHQVSYMLTPFIYKLLVNVFCAFFSMFHYVYFVSYL